MTTGGVTTIMTKVGPVVGVTAKGWKGRSLNLIDTLKKIIPLEVQPTTSNDYWWSLGNPSINYPSYSCYYIWVYLFGFQKSPPWCFASKRNVIWIVCHLTLNILTVLLSTIGASNPDRFFVSKSRVCHPDRECWDLFVGLMFIVMHVTRWPFCLLLGGIPWTVDRAGTRLGQSMMWSHESWSPHMLFEWITLRKTSISNHRKT